MFKKIAVSTLACTFALAIAIPASALDREDKAPRENRAPRQQQQTSAVKAHVGVSGHGDPNRLRFTQRPSTSHAPAGIFEKAECSFTCGDWIVTCSGEAVGCTDSSCVASGGGQEIGAVCVEED